MPLARYFYFVGGALLVLLFILDAYLSKFPVGGRANADLAVIRIQSDRKWPERIVYDTSMPTIIPTPIANMKVSVHAPAMIADVSDKAREREAFAQLRTSDANQLKPSDPKKREAKLQRERKNKIARRRAVPPPFLIARQPQFGWFGNSIW